MSDRISALLNNGKELAADTVKLLDPTGITSWKDAYDAVKHINKNNIGTWANAGIEVLGALPVVGKIGKLGKVGKLVRKTENLLSVNNKVKKAIQIGKIPGKIVRQTIVIPSKAVQSLVNTSINTFRKTPKAIDNTLVTRKLNNTRNFIKGTKVLGDLDNIVTGGTFTKKAAYFVGNNSAGTANSIIPLLAVVNKVFHGDPYTGMAKANDDQRVATTNQNPLKQVIFGTGGFKKYNKPLYLNGERLTNTYYGKIYPGDSIIANKKLKNTMQSADSENMYSTNNETPVIDTNHFRIKFNNKIARSSDRWDWNPYSISGKLMTAATKPTWLYPNAGITTFVDETPVRYTNQSDSTLTTILGK